MKLFVVMLLAGTQTTAEPPFEAEVEQFCANAFARDKKEALGSMGGVCHWALSLVAAIMINNDKQQQRTSTYQTTQ